MKQWVDCIVLVTKLCQKKRTKLLISDEKIMECDTNEME